MPELEKFPEKCRQAIRSVAQLLDTDYTTAWFTILAESVMTDMDPADPAIPEIIARRCRRCMTTCTRSRWTRPRR